MTESIQSNVMQWKFTSCGFNIENRSGFSTFSMSEGLTQGDKDDLVKFAGGYSAPDGLPLQPTTEEELALFPIAFASFRLRSGKRAVTRTRYVGKDYAGVRFGNLFSHGFIIDGDWNFAPIRLSHSPLFADGLTVEEQNLGRTPDPLPCISIDEEHLYGFGVTDYLDDVERFDWFKKLLFAVRSYRQSGKTTVLRDDTENVLNWFAALQETFPPIVTQDISFSTYVRSPSAAGAFQIAATSLEGHSFSFDSSKLAIQCFPFDFASGNIPSLENAETLFASRLSRDAHPSDELQKTFAFLEKCGVYDDETLRDIEPLQTLDNAVLLYDQFVVPSCSLDNEQFDAMLQFFQSLPLEVRQRVLDSNEETHDFFPKLNPKYSFERYERLVKTFAETAYQAESSDLQERFQNGFLSQIVSVIEHLNSRVSDNAKSVLRRLMAILYELDACNNLIVEKFLRDNVNKRYNVEIVPLLLECLSPFIKAPQFGLFATFIINQCDCPLQVGAEQDKMENDLDAQRLSDHDVKVLAIYNIIADFSRHHRDICERILPHIEKNIEQNRDRIFTLFFLFWVLHIRDDGTSQSAQAERIKKIIRDLHPAEQRAVFEKGVILNGMLNKATSFEIHEWLDGTFEGVNSQQSEYKEFLRRSGSLNWREGKEASPQASAFMEYILNAATPVFKRWTEPSKIGGCPEITGCFIEVGRDGKPVFHDDKKTTIEFGVRREEREKRERYGKNICDVLAPLLLPQNRKRLDTLRNRLQLYKRPWYVKCMDSCAKLLTRCFNWCVERYWWFIPSVVVTVGLIIVFTCWLFGAFSSKTDQNSPLDTPVQTQNAVQAADEPNIPPPVAENPPQD